MKIEGVIFDLDGTLFDSIEDIKDANNAMLRSFGWPGHGVEKYIEWVGNGAMQLVRSSLPSTAKVDEDSLANYLATYEKNYRQNIVVKSNLYPGISELLDFLTQQDLPLAINTNKPQQHTDLIVSKCFQPWKFKLVLGQTDAYPRKPDPAGALRIAEQLELNPGNIVFIGDSMVDINTAINAGMIPLGVTWGYGAAADAKSMDNTFCVDTPQEVIDFIKFKQNENEK